MFQPIATCINIDPANKSAEIFVNIYNKSESMANNVRIRCPPNRSRKYSGIVDIPEDTYTGRNIQPSINKMIIAFHSNAPTANPFAAAVPAKPTKCPDPMFDENNEAATGTKNIERDARKKSPASCCSPAFLRLKWPYNVTPKPVPITRAKYPPITP